MASGAGLNRVEGVLLSNTGTTPYTTPLTGYGTLGVTDSGMVLCEARDFTKWTFSMIMAVGSAAAATGYAVTVFGTLDPLAYAAFKLNINPAFYQMNNQPNPAGIVTAQLPNGTTRYQPPASSWFVLPAPSDQTGTGPVANPMTSSSPLMQYSGALKAVRVVLTAASATTGSITVNAEVAP